MLLRDTIAQAYLDQQQFITRPVKQEVERLHLADMNPNGPHIEVIAGIRRCGKSTLLLQIMRQRIQRPAYFNFEDSRIYGFEMADFEKLDAVMGRDVDAYCFDEIQNVDGWEVFVRQLHDRGAKVYLTGSNASLLSSELGTRLTGRYLKHELFPFSYFEFMSYTGKPDSTKAFQDYLNRGGFPEFLQSGQIEVLQQLFKDIIYRDIAVRHGIRNSQTLMDVALYLLSNTGKEQTFNSIRKAFDIGSVNTVADYYAWLEDAYLVQSLLRFSWSASKRNVNPRKVYAIDTGLAKANSLSFSEDSGRMLENAVFLHLRRSGSEMYFFREKKECDFVVFDGRKCQMAIQVCETLHADNQEREIAGLLEAVQQFKLSEGYIVTLAQEDKLVKDGITIRVVPVNRFFAEG